MSDQLTCETPRYFGDTKLSLNVVDDNTIDITADPAQPILPLFVSLVTIVPSDTPTEFVREPVGTGPYKLESWTPGQSVVLERRDDYWGEQPAVEKATYVFRTDPAVAAAMVENGEADLAPSTHRWTRPTRTPTFPISTRRRPTCVSTAQFRQSATSGSAWP